MTETRLDIPKNRKFVFTATVKLNGVAQNVTSGQFIFVAKYEPADTNPIFTCSTLDGEIVLTTPISGLITVTISASKTSSLPNYLLNGVWELIYYPFGTSDTISVARGPITVYPSLT